MKNKFKFYSLLISLIGIVSINAQSFKSDFDKTIDSINRIIKANKLAYYNSGYITKISVTEQGIVHFTDSIPKPEIPTATATATTKREFISDCCPRKNSRTLHLFAIKEWSIHFPYLYLKDENNETFAKFLGFRKPDLEKLKDQFNKLTALCKEKSTTK
ncbi:hypothetical protein [Flavobacterium sp.]|uniref:hypothetical protein n=1 Tax=Flavobacterium sp. TaxID=239 RepID=UPI003C5BF2E1